MKLENYRHEIGDYENMRNDTREFSYDEEDEFGPSRWYLISPLCGDPRMQSPIDINLHNVEIGNIFEPLEIDGLDQLPASITAMNNGHSLVLRFTYDDEFKVTARKGPLEDRSYTIDSIHWHWGENDFGGSEHKLNGRQFSAEGHVILYGSEFGL